MLQHKGRVRIAAGSVTLIVQHELWDGNLQDHSDQGVAVLVTGEADGKETTLLRFNCFDIEKSYIYGPEKANELFRMDPTVDGNPIGWTIKQIRTMLPEMLVKAGYPEIAGKVDVKVLADALSEVEAISREKYATERNTVKHNRGTDIFEAGNIRFGLEMRKHRPAVTEGWRSTS
jgi:hypothetical protein